MVEDAVEAIGFGKFQWKLSVLTGLAWASIPGAVASRSVSKKRLPLLPQWVSMICKEGHRPLRRALA